MISQIIEKQGTPEFRVVTKSTNNKIHRKYHQRQVAPRINCLHRVHFLHFSHCFHCFTAYTAQCVLCTVCFLPTKQGETYLKICVLIYHLTYIFPSLFGWKENMIFEETVILTDFECSKKCFLCLKIKSDTSFMVFILKQYRKNNVKTNFPPIDLENLGRRGGSQLNQD